MIFWLSLVTFSGLGKCLGSKILITEITEKGDDDNRVVFDE